MYHHICYDRLQSDKIKRKPKHLINEKIYSVVQILLHESIDVRVVLLLLKFTILVSICIAVTIQFDFLFTSYHIYTIIQCNYKGYIFIYQFIHIMRNKFGITLKIYTLKIKHECKNLQDNEDIIYKVLQIQAETYI